MYRYPTNLTIDLTEDVQALGGIGPQPLLALPESAPKPSIVLFMNSSASPIAVFELSSLLAANGGDGSTGFVINGIDDYDGSGISVSSAGDVNGDGFDDILIGAAGGDPNGNSTAGESYVVFGQAGGFGASLDLSLLNGTNGFVINGIDYYDSSGISVSSAGDVNGDSFDDILIGARSADPNGNFGAGESYVVFGQAGGFGASVELSSLNGLNGFRLNGVSQGDDSGYSVSSAGDINGDGYDDILIGAPDASTTNSFSSNRAGESYVVFGQASGFAASLNLSTLNGTNGFTIRGASDYDNSGTSVSSAGDINGDGYDDILIGADHADESYVVFGGAGGFNASLELSALNGANGFAINDGFSHSVSSAGDINGDGLDDILIGGFGVNPDGVTNSAETYVVFGQVGGFGPSLDLSTLNGGNGFVINGGFRHSVSSAGDINGDGLDDILIGSSGGNPNGLTSAGESYVVFGQVGGFGPSLDLSTLNGGNGFVINGIEQFDNSGGSVSSAGDINNDGFDDILIGAQYASAGGDRRGESYVIFGRADFGPTIENLTANDDVFTASDTGEIVRALAGADVLNGGAGDDVFFGGEGGDTLVGNGGNDRFEGGAGNDSLDGGEGYDVAIYDGNLSDYNIVKNVDLTYTVTDGVNGNGVDTLTDIEAVQVGFKIVDLSTIPYLLNGTAGNDTLTGSEGDDLITAFAGIDIVNGLAGDDTIEGGDGDDTLNGGDGNDALFGQAGADIIDGGEGSDTVFYTSSNAGVTIDLNTEMASGGHANGDQLSNIENVSGSAFGDIFIGDAGANQLLGLEGDDVITGGFGTDIISGGAGDDLFIITNGVMTSGVTGTHSSDVIDGGSGTDTLDFTGYVNGELINVDLAALTYTSFGGTQTIRDVENVTGSDLDDMLRGNSSDNVLNGGDGDDDIDGYTGNDTINGGVGDDIISGDDGDDVIDGGDGNDVINGGYQDDTINGGAGDDTIEGSYGNDTLIGGDGQDTLQFTRDAVFDDSIGTQTTLQGTDTISGFEIIVSDYGNDTFTLGASDFNDIRTVFAGPGNDTVTETLLLEGDFADGGYGVDTFAYDELGVALTFDLTSGAILTDGGVAAQYINFENVVGSDDAAVSDIITGTDGANLIEGRAGDDMLNGEGGDDTINSGNGDDTLNGGEGNDTLRGGSGSDTLVLSGNFADYTITSNGNGSFQIVDNVGTDGTDTLVSIELVQYADGTQVFALTGSAINLTENDDTFTGGSASETINGLGGNDVINAGGGDDTINGGDGNDKIEGGLGADVIEGGDGDDIVYGDAATLGVTPDEGSYIGDKLSGGAGDDMLIGGNANDVLNGGDDNDTLEGGRGNDIIRGQSGTDTLVVSGNFADYTITDNGNGSFQMVHNNGGIDGTDTLVSIEFVEYADGTQAFAVSSNDVDLTENADTFTGTALGEVINALGGSDIVNGAAGDDVINGGDGNDLLRGDSGDDTLDGGFGVDWLRGGTGADVLNGWAGQDWADYITSSAAVTVNLETNTASGGDAQGDTFLYIERVYGSSHDDHITGDAGVNYLRGWSGDDQLFGGAGNDYLQGGLGADTLDGGAGSDWAVYISSGPGLQVDLGFPASANIGESVGDVYISIENVIGSNHDDTIFGDSQNNFLRGANGDDVLVGGGGDDFLRGEAGADAHNGGAGNDWAYYIGSNSAVTVNLALNTGSGGESAGRHIQQR